MKTIVIAAAALALSVPALVRGQTKTITGETRTETATVEAIETSSRTLTLKRADGTYTTLVAPADMKGFSNIKIGDTITARYYENIVLRVKQPGETETDSAGAAVTRAAGSSRAGTAAMQRTITATITDIDRNVPSITFTGPNDWKYSSRVEDKNALEKVEVGDKVEITWTEAVLISAEPASQK